MVSSGQTGGAGHGTCIIAQEGPSGGDGDPLPDTDGLGVAGVSTLCVLIEAPVPVTRTPGCGLCRPGVCSPLVVGSLWGARWGLFP